MTAALGSRGGRESWRGPRPGGPQASLVAGERAILWCLLLLLAGMPLHFFILHLTGDASVVRYWKEILFTLVLVWYLGLEKQKRRLGMRAIVSSRAVALFAIAVVVRAAVGLVAGEDRYLVVFGVYNWLFFVPLAGVAWGILRTSASIDRWIYRLMVVIALAGAGALLDWQLELARNLATLSDRNLQFTSYVGSGYRAYLGTDGPMELGIYLAAGTLMAAYFLFRRVVGGRAPGSRSVEEGAARVGPRRGDNVRVRLGAAVCWALSAAGLWVTFSRGPLVAAVAGHAVLFLFLRRGVGVQGLTQAPLRAVALLWLVVPIAIVGALSLSGGVKDFFGSAADWSRDRGNVVRLVRWGLAANRFLDSPLIGDGIGEASTRLQQYRTEELGQPYFQAESSLLVAAVEGGVLLLVPLAVLVFRLFGALVRTAATGDSVSRQQAVLMLGIFTAFGLEATINPMFDFRSFVLLTWLFYGIAMRLAAPRVTAAR